MKHLTVRNLPSSIARALEKERRAQGASLNQTVIRLLGRALGIASQQQRSNGLARLAGTWTEDEHETFERAVADMFENIDPEAWR